MTDNEKQLQNLLIAVVTLEKTQETTSQNIDKIVGHLDNLLPIHTDITSIKRALYGSISIGLIFAAWITIDHHRVDSLQQSHKAVQALEQARTRESFETMDARIKKLEIKKVDK